MCDHMEILYHLEIVAQQIVQEQGLSLTRTASLTTSPRFIDVLADVIQRSLS